MVLVGVTIYSSTDEVTWHRLNSLWGLFEYKDSNNKYIKNNKIWIYSGIAAPVLAKNIISSWTDIQLIHLS